MKYIFSLAIAFNLIFYSRAQETICLNETLQHTIHSRYLNENRTYWVSLPLNYSDSLSYPVVYVLDAEWRFELIKNIAYDLGANNKIQKSIVIGIPHIDWEMKRGIDLTFSQSRMEYDGDQVDSTWYNSSNSGGGEKFYHYLTLELMPDVDKNYSTNDHQTLIGHSYGGYFGGYLLSMENPFEVIHIYDPAIWYSNGEVTDRFRSTENVMATTIHVTYQSEPEFHRKKIEEFIRELKRNPNITLTTRYYESETHNSLYLDSFYQGIQKTNNPQ